ncbi:hypothetical protein ACJX0J_036805 [Zea mays]
MTITILNKERDSTDYIGTTNPIGNIHQGQDEKGYLEVRAVQAEFKLTTQKMMLSIRISHPKIFVRNGSKKSCHCHKKQKFIANLLQIVYSIAGFMDETVPLLSVQQS